MKIKAGQFFFRELECCWVVLWYLTGEERKRGTDVGVLTLGQEITFHVGCGGAREGGFLGSPAAAARVYVFPRKERPIFSHMKIKTWKNKARFFWRSLARNIFLGEGWLFQQLFESGEAAAEAITRWFDPRKEETEGGGTLCCVSPWIFLSYFFSCAYIWWVGGEGIITPVKTRRRCCCCPLYSPGGREFFPSSVVVVTGVKWSDAFPASI